MGNIIYNRICDYCKTEYTGAGKKFCSIACGNLNRRGSIVSDFTREKISSTHLKNQKNKGRKIDPETKEKMSASIKKVWENPEFKKSMSEKRKGHPVSEETKEKIRLKNIGVKRPYVTEYNKKREKVKGWKHTKESKNKISEGNKGKNNGMHGKLPVYSKYTSYKKGTIEIKMRSTWEVLFAEYLDSIEKNWEYEKYTFDLGEWTYTPDFFVDGIFYEVKGYLHEHSKEKMKKFKEIYNDRILILVDREKMIELGILK
jgi:hypothetical protein